MKKQVVIVVDPIFGKAEEIFNSVDHFHIITGPEDEKLLSEQIAREDPFGVVLGTKRYSGALYEKMRAGGVLARFGVGCDGLDFEKAKKHNLFITNTPGVLDQTVAEYTVFLAAEVLRKIGHVSRLMKEGTWKSYMGNDLNGKTWTIIGFGNIGKKLSMILGFGFGVRVLGLNSGNSNINEYKTRYGVEQLFTDYSSAVSEADIISLHLPANSQTMHYLDKSRLEKLKPGAILINTARGSLLDESALYDALAENKIAGAGLDVFEAEPYAPVSPDKDLRKLSNVIMSPHLGSSTTECCNRMALSVISDLKLAREKKYDRMNLVQNK